MKKIMKKLSKAAIVTTLSCAFAVSSVCCGGGNGSDKQSGSSGDNIREEVVLPDYENMQSRQFIINAWYAPEPTEEAFKAYKECGFNYIFLMGNNVGAAGSPRIEQALTLCDNLGLKAFVDVSRALPMIDAVIDGYVKHPSFVGFNYDEPVIYKNSINNADGIVDIGPVVDKMHKKYPDVEFLVNLNPTTSLSFNWGTPSFTYEEYLEAQENYINSVYDGSDVDNWLSCDDYPLYYDPSSKTPYYLKRTWLQNLEYLAEAKRDSDMKLVTNFFIQTMAYGTNAAKRNRKPSYEDIRMQTYTLLAFGYDSVSYFCYGTPPTGEEFTETQYGLVDRNGNKTDIYESGKLVNEEMRRLEKVYMQFNSRWLGVCPVYGKNNTDKDPDYYNKTMDSMFSPLTVSRLSGIKEVSSDEDLIIGHMKDERGNSGFMLVNYNETTLKKQVNAELTFNNFTKADVYKNGEKTTVSLVGGKLSVHLDTGEGVFVIPHG